MESHSSVRGAHKEKGSSVSVESKKLDIENNQASALLMLNAIAKAKFTSAQKKYNAYFEAAQAWDNDQEVSTFALEDFLKWSERTTAVALLTHSAAKNQ